MSTENRRVQRSGLSYCQGSIVEGQDKLILEFTCPTYKLILYVKKKLNNIGQEKLILGQYF